MRHQKRVITSVIKDLDFVQPAENKNTAVGGARTRVHGTARTGYATAFASIDSLSLGTQTYTSSLTSTRVSQTYFSVTSTAEAEGSAIAQSGNASSRSSARYYSTSLHINYSHN